MTHASIAPRNSHRRPWQALTLGLAALLGLATAGRAEAQAPAVNFGFGLNMRLENSTNHDGAEPLGQARLMVNAILDTDEAGPYVLSLEQGGRALTSGTCDVNAVVYSGEAQPNLGALRECSTDNVATASIRVDQPVTVVIALINEATDARVDVYRGEFPVFASWWWDRNDGDRAIHIEHRSLRLDSFFGAGFLRHDVANSVVFSYADTTNGADVPQQSSLRCRVGTGEWRAYEGYIHAPHQQHTRNRVWLDGTVHEDGAETLTTRIYQYAADVPFAIEGSGATPSGGNTMDGAWTCELRIGPASARVVTREFRFDVVNGMVRRHALEAQVPAGRGSVMVSVGLNPAAPPVILDPALVRGAIAGRALRGATAPILSALPARAVNPAFTTPRAAPAARGGGRRR